MGTLMNVARNALRPGWGREMLHKLWLRWNERELSRTRAECIAWCKRHTTDAAEWAGSIDADLWREAQAFAQEQQALASRKAGEMKMRIGGAGFYDLLYFLTRATRPENIVETGVAFGFSSRAFLIGLEANGKGRLYSSDFPYFRRADPESLIGCLVEAPLRKRWTLLVGSDRDNLPKIVSLVSRVDVMHYDSDKSYSGRKFALSILRPVLTANCLVIFDDIQDNPHFRDLVESGTEPFLVFEFNGKWIGVTGGPAAFYTTTGAKLASSTNERV